MKRYLQAFWTFLKEFSGEAAIERRMACSCHSHANKRQAVTEAVEAQFSNTQRCC